MSRAIVWILVALVLQGCAFLESANKQFSYRNQQKENPSQKNRKYILDEGATLVFGHFNDPQGLYRGHNLALVAYSDQFLKNELVSQAFARGSEAFVNLYLAGGLYEIAVFADLDGDGIYRGGEQVGIASVQILDGRGRSAGIQRVEIELQAEPLASSRDLELGEPPELAGITTSKHYPSVLINSLDDPVFDERLGQLGMYQPAIFMESVPGMVYAEQEIEADRTPVVFVHGLGGSSRIFKQISSGLDHGRFQALHFYYPSGADLTQTAEAFYQIFLSGRLFRSRDTSMIIVAHSMGGVLVREALNRFQASDQENRLELFVSLASPFGGHPLAPEQDSRLKKYLLPSWKAMHADSEFIRGLFRKPLPRSLRHALLFFYRNNSRITMTKSSDGVIPISSQLRTEAQAQATHLRGFDETHVGGVKDNEVLAHLLDLLESSGH